VCNPFWSDVVIANPLTPIDALLPDDAAFMARTELSQLRRLGMGTMNLDTVTGHALGVIGRRPSVRHEACVTDEILAFMTDAGLPITEDIRVYRDADQAERHADDLIAAGYRLFGPYPLREGRFSPEAQLVPAPLWRRLNSKANLGQLVPSEHLAPRQMWHEGEMLELPAGGVYLKFGGTEATGAGHCVRYCPDTESFAQALDWFRAEGCADQLVMEQAIDTDIIRRQYRGDANGMQLSGSCGTAARYARPAVGQHDRPRFRLSPSGHRTGHPHRRGGAGAWLSWHRRVRHRARR